MIETLSDENNSFLSRREITCDFKGLGGKLKNLEAIEMVTKEFKLDGNCLLYTSPSPRDPKTSRMPSSA